MDIKQSVGFKRNRAPSEYHSSIKQPAVKRFSNIPENSVLAGTPAHFVKENVRRIRDVENERKLREYFRENKGANSVNAEHIGIRI